MKFSQLTRAQAQLHGQVLQKEAFVSKLVGGVIKAPFQVAGAVAKGAGRVAAVPIKAGARSTIKRHGKIMGGLMLGGAALGTAAVAGSAIGKGREYNRGFDPRVQNASMQRVR